MLLIACSLISSLASALQGDTVQREKSGKNIALHCPCHRGETIIFLLWSKFNSLNYKILSRVSHEFPYQHPYQDPSFKDRVELKDGDLTLILKTVSIRDTGRYNCWVEFKNKSISGGVFTCCHYFNLTVTAAEQKNITVGQTVVLPCRAPNDNSEPNAGVRWSRPDLDPQNVLLYLDKTSLPDEQHPSFKNRVDLQDRQMKDGDVSLVLKDVTTADSGTYECHVFRTGTNRGKTAQLDGEHINTIILGVVPPGPGGTTEDEEEENNRRMKDRLIRPVIGLCVFGVFVGVVCFLSHRRHKEQSQDSNQPPAEQQQVQMLQLNHEAPAPLPSDLSSDR